MPLVRKALIFSMILLFITGQSQRLLQLEVTKEVKAIKFYEGDKITLKTKSYPKAWQHKFLDQILVDDQVLLFEDGMENINNITHVKLQNTGAKAAGRILSTFGMAWLVFGGIAHFTSRNKLTWADASIGLTAVGVGEFFNRVVSTRTYHMGKNANLRTIDISFPSPEEVILKQNK